MKSGMENISNNNGATVTFSKTDITCSGSSTGAIQTTVSGGVTPYSYLWSTGDTTANIANLAAGNYTLSVSDANGCQTITSVTLTTPVALSISLNGQDAYCNSHTGTISAAINGGTTPYSLSWSNGMQNPVINGLTAGSYAVTVTDSIGCSTSASTTLNFFPGPTTTVQPSNLVCYNDSSGGATVNVSGVAPPYNILWSTGDQQANITGLSAGNYQLTVTDTNGCQDVKQFLIIQPQPLTIQTTVSDDICGVGDGIIALSVNGGTTPYDYSWSDGSHGQSILSNLNGGSYQVTVTDTMGCTETVNATVDSNIPLQVTLAPPRIVQGLVREALRLWSMGGHRHTVTNGMILRYNQVLWQRDYMAVYTWSPYLTQTDA